MKCGYCGRVCEKRLCEECHIGGLAYALELIDDLINATSDPKILTDTIKRILDDERPFRYYQL